MSQQIFRPSRWLLPLLGALTFALMAPEAMADRGDRGHGRDYGNYHQHYKHHHRQHGYYRAPRRVKVVEHYYYREPSHHHHHYSDYGSPGASISVTLPLGTIVHGLPGGYVSFNLGGDPYYYHGGNYYRPYRRGYEVISAPRGHRW